MKNKNSNKRTVNLTTHKYTGTINLDEQPFQLELFQQTMLEGYTNTFQLYQALPGLVLGKQTVLRNEDGTAKPINRVFSYKNTKYDFKIIPGYIEEEIDGHKKDVAYFKGLKEDLVERVIHKLAVEGGFFSNDGDSNSHTDNFVLQTTLYQIKKELKKRNKTYSNNQIKEALMILSTITYVLHGAKDNDVMDIPFSPFKASVIQRSREDKVDSKVIIHFNPLISKNILLQEFTLQNYKRIMEGNNPLDRYMLTRIYTRFKQANNKTTYHLLLSTLFEEGIMKERKSISSNIEEMEAVLKRMPDIIKEYEVIPKETINPKTKRKKIIDAKFVMKPTEQFIKERIRMNAHEQALSTPVYDENEEIIIKPFPDQYEDYNQYLLDYKKYTKLYIKQQD